MNRGHRYIAKSKGQLLYFTGTPCKHGHLTDRRTATGKCVECERLGQLTDKQKEYHRKLKKTEKYRSMARKYRSSIYGTVKYREQSRATHLKRTYNITPETFQLMVQEQNGLCKICAVQFDNNILPCVDHCHETGAIRGVLCKLCNQLLGFSRDNTTTLQRAIEYLKG